MPGARRCAFCIAIRATTNPATARSLLPEPLDPDSPAAIRQVRYPAAAAKTIRMAAKTRQFESGASRREERGCPAWFTGTS